MTGRAKYDAWLNQGNELAKESMSDIQDRYLALVGKYGWVYTPKQGDAPETSA